MHILYGDILKRIAEKPEWYDSNGVPRYEIFNPDMCPNIYSNGVGLFLIACQSCGMEFKVEMHLDIFGRHKLIPPNKWHYGDPPAHRCAGDSMNCEDLEVLFFFHRNDSGEWERKKEFEGPMGHRN